MQWYRWVGFAAGFTLVFGTWLGVISALILPRRGRSLAQRVVGSVTRGVFNGVAHKFKTYNARDRILAFQAPTFLVVLLGVWITAFLLGYALLFWPFAQGGGFDQALNLSVSSLFTLGFAVDTAAAPRVITSFAAATGLVVVALQIAYLPVLYGAFNRRETLVTLLEARAGTPAWGPELLARHELIDNVDSLGRLYEAWEAWCADLAESHQTYPVLLWFRSPEPQRSWVLGLISMLDAAALHLSTRPLTAPPQARPFMRMGYMALRDLASVVNIPVNDDPKPEDHVELSKESFMDAVHHLEHVGWPFERDPEEAWTHFRGWRVTYESLAYGLADIINAPPALWAGTRQRLPMHLQPPLRPPHREPSAEIVNVKHTTRQRRAIRSGKAVPVQRTGHDQHAIEPHPHEGNAAQPRAIENKAAIEPVPAPEVTADSRDKPKPH